MPTLTSRDIIALALIAALVIFKLTGHNGTLDVAVALVVGYYFGRRNEVTIQAPPDIQPLNRP